MPTVSWQSRYMRIPFVAYFLCPLCMFLVRGGWGGFSCGGVHGCVRCVGAGAPGLGSRYNLTVVGSQDKKGQKPYLTQPLYMMAKLICYFALGA
jgi:hypothetical protein